MPESVLTVLKFCFLALLYLFLYRVVRVVVKEMRAPAPSPIVDAAVAAPVPAAAPVAAKPRGRAPAHLRILEPDSRRGETTVITAELTIGRGGGCGIVLADDSFVSTVHGRVFHRDGEVWVEDLGSRNGTLLNGQALVHASPLRRGDQLQFGRTVIEATK